MRTLTQEKKDKIIYLLNQGLSHREIARQCNVSTSSVSQVRQKSSLTITKNKGGRRKKLTPRESRYIMRQIASGRVSSARNMVPVMNEELNIICSERTIRRALNNEGMIAFKRRKKPKISAINRRKRRLFAEAHQHWTIDDWKRVVWSDETKINRIGSDGIRWGWRRRVGDPCTQQIRPNVQSGGGHIIMWGCLTYDGVGFACKIDGRLDSQLYVKILEEELEQTLDYYKIQREKIIFMQDNAPAHTARRVWGYFEDVKLTVMEWPPYSPDLNPIEHLWSFIKRKLGMYPQEPTSIHELWNRVQQEWNAIPDSLCKSLIESLPRRINAVIKAKGGNTQY